MTLIELDTPSTGTARRRVDAAMASSYLALGHPHVDDAHGGVRVVSTPALVATADELVDALADRVPTKGDVGLLLDGGPGGALLAALMPPDTPCYTITCAAPGVADHATIAAEQAVHWGHPHLAVRISWSDHLAHVKTLMTRKDAPLHRSEVPLYLAAQIADADGISTLVLGSGADAIFGGHTELLASDWTFDEFAARARVANPADYLTDPVDTTAALERHRVGDEVDVTRYLREVRATGVAAAHRNALSAAGATMIAPFLDLAPRGPLDLTRIRAGEAAPMIADAYRLLYDTDTVPTRLSGVDPMDDWLAGWAGPRPRPGLRDDLLGPLASATGAQRWLLWCLAAYLDLVDRAPSTPLLGVGA